MYSNDVSLRIESTDELPYIQIEKRPKSLLKQERAEQIKYSYKIEGNQLIFRQLFHYRFKK
jgi:hypothetical protein